MMSLKAFALPAPARDSDCSVSKQIKVGYDDCMENVMSEKSWKSPETSALRAQTPCASSVLYNIEAHLVFTKEC